jgi:hypothetical protein
LLGRFSPVRTRGFVGSRLLWPAELQHGFIVAVAHQVFRSADIGGQLVAELELYIKVTDKALLSTDMYICVDRS